MALFNVNIHCWIKETIVKVNKITEIREMAVNFYDSSLPNLPYLFTFWSLRSFPLKI
jgi:hypothetical protein